LLAGFLKIHVNVYGAWPPDALPTNVHDTGAVAVAVHGVFCTLIEPVSTGIEVVVVDVVVVVTGAVVVVVALAVVVVVDVVVGPVDPPQLVAASMPIATII